MWGLPLFYAKLLAHPSVLESRPLNTVNTVPHCNMRQQKQELRRLMEAKRQEAALQFPDAAVTLRDHALKNITFPPACIVASYHKRGSEMDPLPLTDALRARGCVIALPVIDGKKSPLLFRRYEPSDALTPGHFGTQEPFAEAPMLEPDILLVPLLGFDRMKGRLGYGGGFYDRTINNLRQRKPIMAIGIAYNCQEVLEIPMGSFDARLDKIATDVGIF
jgi:5-formyltetrahydrofolate cyclo-ligase